MKFSIAEKAQNNTIFVPGKYSTFCKEVQMGLISNPKISWESTDITQNDVCNIEWINTNDPKVSFPYICESKDQGWNEKAKVFAACFLST